MCPRHPPRRLVASEQVGILPPLPRPSMFDYAPPLCLALHQLSGLQGRERPVAPFNRLLSCFHCHCDRPAASSALMFVGLSSTSARSRRSAQPIVDSPAAFRAHRDFANQTDPGIDRGRLEQASVLPRPPPPGLSNVQGSDELAVIFPTSTSGLCRASRVVTWTPRSVYRLALSCHLLVYRGPPP